MQSVSVGGKGARSGARCGLQLDGRDDRSILRVRPALLLGIRLWLYWRTKTATAAFQQALRRLSVPELQVILRAVGTAIAPTLSSCDSVRDTVSMVSPR